MKAILAGNLDIAAMLIELGANINAKDMDGDTALTKAVATNSNNKDHHSRLLMRDLKTTYLDLMTMLVEHGADIDVKNKHGENPLLKATEEGLCGVADLLLMHGVEIDIEKHNWTSSKLTESRAFSSQLASRELVPSIWASIVTSHSLLSCSLPAPLRSSSPSSSASSASSSPAFSRSASFVGPTHQLPPPPFQRCPWTRFISIYLPPVSAQALYLRVAGAHTDAAACIYFLCIRRVRRMTGVGGLWPIRNTLRDFLVYPDAATRRLLRQLEPVLKKRSQVLNRIRHGHSVGTLALGTETAGGHAGGAEERELWTESIGGLLSSGPSTEAAGVRVAANHHPRPLKKQNTLGL
jgi:hypothetical protein